MNKSLAVVWHERISDRNDEDVTSALLKSMNSVEFRDYENYVMWLDNCAGQNKNWTLYTKLTNYVNSQNAPVDNIEVCCCWDNFYHLIEGEMEKMKNVCDRSDFI